MRGEKGREESNFSGGGIGQGARKFFERGEKGREKKISEEGGRKKFLNFFWRGEVVSLIRSTFVNHRG